VKVYEIRGELTVTDDQNHHEMLTRLFNELKKLGIHFAGTTKHIADKIE
jgi:hypothetical protein